MKTLILGGLLSSLSLTALSWISTEPSLALAVPQPTLSMQAEAEPRGVSEYVLLHMTRDERTPLQVATHANSCRGTHGGVRS